MKLPSIDKLMRAIKKKGKPLRFTYFNTKTLSIFIDKYSKIDDLHKANFSIFTFNWIKFLGKGVSIQ